MKYLNEPIRGEKVAGLTRGRYELIRVDRELDRELDKELDRELDKELDREPCLHAET